MNTLSKKRFRGGVSKEYFSWGGFRNGGYKATVFIIFRLSFNFPIAPLVTLE